MKIITSDNLPTPNGHYSQCIEHNGILYLSGQLPINPVTKEISGEITGQTKQVFDNIETILSEAGSSLDKIIQVRIYISDIQLWDEINELYSGIFWNHRPVRSILPVNQLHFNCLLEVEVLAILP